MTKHTFTLRTRPERCPLPCSDCQATIEVVGRHTLYELAAILVEAIGFDFDHAFGFYDNTKDHYKSTVAYTAFAEMGDPEEGELPPSEAAVADVFSPGKAMAFLFDYGDGWEFLITCEKVEKSAAKKRGARLLALEGTPPVQYPDWED